MKVDLIKKNLHLVPVYAKRTRYANRSFVIQELKRTLAIAVRDWVKSPTLQKYPAKVWIHISLAKRTQCFGEVEKLFKLNAGIPRSYASKLGGYHKLAWERDDVISELNIKMLMTIRAWGRRYGEFLVTGRYKPVTLDIFIKTAMNNRLKDFFKLVDKSPDTMSITYASEGGPIDIIDRRGECETVIDYKKGVLVIQGEDLLAGLNKYEKACMLLSFSGWKPQELDKKIKRSGNPLPSQIISKRLNKLQQNSTLRAVLAESIQISFT